MCKIVRKNTDCDDLQEDINSLVEWSESRNLKINSNKTEHLRISLKKNCLNTYQINGNPINTVQEHKHLGLIFDSKLNFNQHCDMIVNKARKKFGFLKSLCKYVDGITFLNLYKTYVLPILESNLICWVLNKTQFNRIEMVQKITKFICKKLVH